MTEVDSVELWRVDWTSRYGEFSTDTTAESEIFLVKEDAEKFKESLEAAFRLIRHTHDDAVTCYRYKV